MVASSAATAAVFVTLSLDRLRRMRIAWRFAWVVLVGEVAVFAIWIRDQLYSVPAPPGPGSELFAWAWLGGFSLAAAAGLVMVGRWLRRDAARFDALRQAYEAHDRD